MVKYVNCHHFLVIFRTGLPLSSIRVSGGNW